MVIIMAKKILYIAAVVAAAFLVSDWLRPTECRTKNLTYIVKEGQTVWEIAEMHIEQQAVSMSMSEFVHKIYKANNIDPRLYLQPGDKLIIPIITKEEKNND